MVLTINPAGSGGPREWAQDTGLFVLGNLVGSVGTAFALLAVTGTVSMLVSRTALFVMALPLVTLVILRDAGVRVPVPYRSRQVPQLWRRVLSPQLFAFSYGVLLGVGFLTPFTSAAHVGMLLGIAFADSAWTLLAASVFLALGKSVIFLLAIGTTSDRAVADQLDSSEHLSASRVIARRLTTISVTAAVLATLVTTNLMHV